MGEWKLKIKSGVKAFLWGCAGGIAVVAVVFFVGWAWNGASWAAGYEWQRRAAYIAGACGILICGCGMFTTGGKTRAEQLDPENYEPLNAMERFPGIGWATALLLASFGVIAVETIIETLFYAIY